MVIIMSTVSFYDLLVQITIITNTIFFNIYISATAIFRF